MPNSALRFRASHLLQFVLWRALTPPVIAAIGIFAYLGMWWIAYERLASPAYSARMVIGAYAVASSTSDPDPCFDSAGLSANLVGALSAYKENAPRFDVPERPGTPEKEFLDAAVTLGALKPASPRYIPELLRVSRAADRFGRSDSEARSWWNRFTTDKYRQEGAGLGTRLDGVASIREDAREFLRYYRCFYDPAAPTDAKAWRFGALPPKFQLRPWLLLRFYDPKRAELCEQIPLGLTSLLLSTAFLLRLRLTDFDRHSRSRLMHPGWLAPPKARSEPPHFRLWRKPGESSVQHLLGTIAGLRWGWPTALIGLVLIETLLNTPQVRNESLVNLPIMIIVAITLPSALSALWQMHGMSLNPTLVGHSQQFLTARLRPGIVGFGCLLVADAWMVLHSVTRLLPSPEWPIMLRGVLQASFGLLVFGLLLGTVGRMSRDLDSLSSAKPDATKADSEPIALLGGVTLLGRLWSVAGSDTVFALLAALVPLPNLLRTLAGW